MEVEFKLEAFDGPLDLLLHLIEINKIDIFDIPVAEITDQYIEYINKMENADVDYMSDFMYMAAVLLNIKSRMLLPKEKDEETGEEEDPRAALVERLLEYKVYKYASEELKDKEEDADHVLFKKPTIPDEVAAFEEKPDVDELLSGVTLSKLSDIFYDVMHRQLERIDPVRSRFGKIHREPVNLKDRVVYIRDYGKKHSHFSFRKLLEESEDKITIIVTFLGVLELMKSGELRAAQKDIESDIEIDYIEKREKIETQ